MLGIVQKDRNERVYKEASNLLYVMGRREQRDYYKKEIISIKVTISIE